MVFRKIIEGSLSGYSYQTHEMRGTGLKENFQGSRKIVQGMKKKKRALSREHRHVNESFPPELAVTVGSVSINHRVECTAHRQRMPCPSHHQLPQRHALPLACGALQRLLSPCKLPFSYGSNPAGTKGQFPSP